MRRGRPNAGFLLAETLITLALSALVLAGLVASTAVLLRATDKSVAAVGASDDLGRTLEALTRDLGNLKRARWDGPEPQGFVFRGGPNSLFFAQEAPSAAGGRVMRVVSLREIAAGRGTTLMRAEAPLPATAAGWGDLVFGATRPVPTGPARLRFRYLAEPVEGQAAPRPLDSWPSGTVLPAAVIVEAVNPASTRLVFSDRIALHADGDIGCADKRPPKRGDDRPQPPQGGGPGAAAATAPPSAAPAGGAIAPPTNRSIDTAPDVANKNEFCGRTDKGVPRGRHDASAAKIGATGAPGASGMIGGMR